MYSTNQAHPIMNETFLVGELSCLFTPHTNRTALTPHPQYTVTAETWIK